MNLLLVQPPLTVSPEVQPPLGLCVLAAHLRRQGHDVSILDLDLEDKASPHRPEQYLETFSELLKKRRFDVVGVTSMFNNSLHAERLIRAAKTVDPAIATIAGGSHFGALPCESLRRIPALDFVIRGEGEVALSQLVMALEDGSGVEQIPGLCFRAGDEVREIAAGKLLDLTEAAPTWPQLGDVIDLRRYLATIPSDAPRKAIYIEAGRGCPFACSFCATAPFWERRYRVKSIDCIIAEMQHLKDMYGYDMFMLVHDLLTADRRFMNDFCEALFASGLPVEWTANHRADIDLGALAPKMRRAGCLSVFMGMESASERIQADIHKGLSRTQMMDTVRTLRDVGIASTCSFILGFPSETATELSETIALACQLKMIGAEPVQVHRLRRWPPAPLAKSDLLSSFDMEALRLEYPSTLVPDADVEAIKSDPAFFVGYFTPASLAGSALELAQLELTFANALTVIPVTTGLLSRIYRERLASAYYRALDMRGSVSREYFDSPMNIRDVLVPYISAWVDADETLEDWQRSLVVGTLAYESVRVAFMAGADDDLAAVVTGTNWSVFETTIDVVDLLGRLAAGADVTADLQRNGYIALTRLANGAVRGFALTREALGRLQRGDREILAALESRELAHLS